VVEQLGYRVAGVWSSGEEALLDLAGAAPDLVLMDIVLAGEMDGVRAASLIGRQRDVPVIFLTATTDEVIGRVGESGAWGYIHKPVKLLDLKANLDMALARAETERKLRYAEERRAVLDALPVAVLLSGLDQNVRWANPKAESLLGASVADLKGRNAASLLAGFFGCGQSCFGLTGQDQDICLMAPSGIRWRVLVTQARDAEALPGGVVVTFHPLEVMDCQS